MADQKNNQKAEESTFERAIRSTSTELHLQQYPVFHLTPQRPTDNCITFSETIREGLAVIQREWSVVIHPAFGWPGEHEAEVWRAIEHIVHLRRMDGILKNPIDTSFSEIREYMSGKGMGGVDAKRIKQAIYCLSSTKIKTSFFYYSTPKLKEEYGFTVISSYSFKKKKLKNGKEVIDRISIELPAELFKNIQNNYIRPLDKGFRDELDKWISKRLYELLGVKFYALRKKNEPYRTRYSRLCALVGVSRQEYLSTARRILGRAHNELEFKGFLSKVEWCAIRNDSHDWVLCYWPGPRARAEWKKDYWKEVRLPEVLVVESLPEIDPEPVWVDQLAPNEATAAAQLTSTFVEQPMLPFVIDTSASIVDDSAQPLASPAHQPDSSNPTPSKHSKPSLDDAYAQTAIEAFEEGSGAFRKLGQLTKKEQECLKTWKECLVNRFDITEGTKEAVKKQIAKASRSGKPIEPIVSLAYVSGHVLDASKKRQNMERLEQDSIQKARARQSKELQDKEAWLKQEIQKQPGLLRMFYRDFLEPLILVEASQSSMILASPLKDCASFFHTQGYLKELAKLCGCPVYVSWVVEWVYGPTWKKQL